jgi:hypothetical protein
MMDHVSHEDKSVSDDELESNANRDLAKRLTGARLHLIGQTVINYLEHKPAECPICERGNKIKAYDKIREHAVCSGCGKATKYLQRSIDAVLKTLEQQKRFWRNYRLTQIKFKRKGSGRGNRGADPGRGVKQAQKALIERFR